VIRVQWSQMGKNAIEFIPWWVGPRLHRKPVDVYWQPVADVVTERINRAFDAESWLAGTKADYVLVDLVHPGLMLYDPSAFVANGSAVVGLTVSDELAECRDVAAVLDHVEAEAITALERVAKALRRPGPARRPSPLPPPPVRDDRICRIGEKYGSVALVPPHMAGRNLADTVAAVAEEVAEHDLHGYRMFRFSQPERVLSADVDFGAIDAPFTLEDLLLDRANVLLVLGERAGELPAALAPLVAGRDRGQRWFALGYSPV
jgi:hypothetical protein